MTQITLTRCTQISFTKATPRLRRAGISFPVAYWRTFFVLFNTKVSYNIKNNLIFCLK